MTLLQTIFKKRKVHAISNLKQNVIETWCDSLLSINLIGWKLPRRRLVVSAGLWLSSRIAHVSMKSFPWPFIQRRHNDVHRTLSIPRRLGHQDVVFTGMGQQMSSPDSSNGIRHESKGWGFESPSGGIFCLKIFDTFTRTSVHVSKMNAVACTQHFKCSLYFKNKNAIPQI